MTGMTEEAAKAEALKRERHKPKTLNHKHWSAVHDSVKGWHVTLVDNFQYVEKKARGDAREALLRGDLVSFANAAAEAILARARAGLAPDD